MEKYFRSRNSSLLPKIKRLQADLAAEFGVSARIVAPIGGRIVHTALRREEKRLNQGWKYQPPAFVEKKNWEQASQPSGLTSWAPVPEPES